MRTYLALFLLAALFSWLATPWIARLGRRLHTYGRARESHEVVPVPRLGGLAVFCAILAAWAVLLLVPNDVRARFVSEWRTVVILLAPATLVLLLGLYDDLRGAKPWQKLLIETLAGGMAWELGLRIIEVPVLGYPLHNALFSFLLTVLWIVAVTNAFNLIDGLDGLAAGIAFFVSLSVLVVSLIQGNPLVPILAVTIAGALLGFLRFNSAPAKIFLGDTGSLFLGCALATLAIHTSEKSSTLLAIAVPYVAFGLPLLDISLSTVRRFLSGRPIFEADCDHVHHRLLKKKLTPRAAVMVLYALAATFSLGSLLIIRSTGSLIVLVAVITGVVAWFVGTQLRYEELTELNVYVSRAIRFQRRVLANEILIRKASKKLENAASLEESWALMADTLQALDFDEMTCHLTGWGNGSTPTLAPWQSWQDKAPQDAWSISVPLKAGEKNLGELRLCRLLAKERMLFQFSSLLDTLIPPFERRLRQCYEAEETNQALEYSLHLASPAGYALIANGRGKA